MTRHVYHPRLNRDLADDYGKELTYEDILNIVNSEPDDTYAMCGDDDGPAESPYEAAA